MVRLPCHVFTFEDWRLPDLVVWNEVPEDWRLPRWWGTSILRWSPLPRYCGTSGSKWSPWDWKLPDLVVWNEVPEDWRLSCWWGASSLRWSAPTEGYHVGEEPVVWDEVPPSEGIYAAQNSPTLKQYCCQCNMINCRIVLQTRVAGVSWSLCVKRLHQANPVCLVVSTDLP